MATRLFSSPESVAQGEPSWLAILETVWAMLLFWGMVWFADGQRLVWMPLWIAPFLLLRSPESTMQGARWFAAYLADKSQITPTGTPIRYWAILLPLIVGVTSFCTALLTDHFLPPQQSDLALFGYATLVGMLALWMAMAMAVAGAMVGSVVVALTVAFSLALGAARSGVAEIAFAWALVVTLVGIVAAPVALMWMGSVAGEGTLAIAILLAGIPWILGVWLRSLGVRLVATLSHPWCGLLALPDNWRRVLWVLDSRHPPELVPGLSRWTRSFSLVEIRGILRAPGMVRKLFGLLAFGCFFLPAILYRWSLKSTVWLYWPLLFLETVPRGRDAARLEPWRASLRQGRWERWRRWLSVFMVGLFFFSLFPPISPILGRVVPVGLLAAWQGCTLAVGLLTLGVYGITRRAGDMRGLGGLVWLRNGGAVGFLGLTVYGFFLY